MNPAAIPIIKKLSIALSRLLCSLSLFVISPIIEYTDTLMTAKDIPTQANKILTEVKELPQYIPRHPIKTRARAINIPFLYPILGRNEPIRKDTNAMERSLNASKELAVTSST